MSFPQNSWQLLAALGRLPATETENRKVKGQMRERAETGGAMDPPRFGRCPAFEVAADVAETEGRIYYVVFTSVLFPHEDIFESGFQKTPNHKGRGETGATEKV